MTPEQIAQIKLILVEHAYDVRLTRCRCMVVGNLKSSDHGVGDWTEHVWPFIAAAIQARDQRQETHTHYLLREQRIQLCAETNDVIADRDRIKAGAYRLEAEWKAEKTALQTKLEEWEKVASYLLNTFGAAFPNYAWTDEQTACDLLLAEIITARAERDALRKERDKLHEACRLAFKLPRPWMDGGITFKDWNEAMQAIEEALGPEVQPAGEEPK